MIDNASALKVVEDMCKTLNVGYVIQTYDTKFSSNTDDEKAIVVPCISKIPLEEYIVAPLL